MTILDSVATVAVTAIAVRYLPKLFRKKPPITVAGTVKPGFEEVQEAFRENFTSGRDPRESGSAFAVGHRGETVVNLYGGYADAEIHQKWKQDTISVVYSTTKAIAATCIAMLADRGLLDYDKAVADYWPEFAQNGKEKVTVRHLMEHKAGIPIAPVPFTYDLLKDCSKCGAMLAAATPLWEPGTAHGYHSVSYGPLTNELLRRVDPQGRTMGRFFADEVAKPFGIDFFIGLPLEENYRVARLIIADASLSTLVNSLKSSRNRQVLRTSLTDTYLLQETAINAGDLQDLLGILSAGGTDPVTSKKLLSREIADSFLDSEPESLDKVLKFPISWKLGMAIDYAEDGGKIFGHPGAGGQVAFADPRYQLGFAFISRYAAPFGLGNDPRYLTLRKAMYNCVKKMGQE